MIYVYNPLRTTLLIPPEIDMTPEPVIPLYKKILRLMIRIAKIMLFINVALVFIVGGTILINMFCPSLYSIWLLFVFVAGYVLAELIFE